MTWFGFLRFRKCWTSVASRRTLSTAQESFSWTNGLSQGPEKGSPTPAKSASVAFLTPSDSAPSVARYYNVSVPLFLSVWLSRNWKENARGSLLLSIGLVWSPNNRTNRLKLKCHSLGWFNWVDFSIILDQFHTFSNSFSFCSIFSMTKRNPTVRKVKFGF